MILEVYIGRFDDPTFKWEGGNWSGNIPKILSPYFPHSSQVFELLFDAIKSKKYEGKKLDWGAWGIKATKSEVIKFVSTCEKTCGNKDFREINIFINKLADDKTYVIVGMEDVSDLDYD